MRSRLNAVLLELEDAVLAREWSISHAYNTNIYVGLNTYQAPLEMKLLLSYNN